MSARAKFQSGFSLIEIVLIIMIVGFILLLVVNLPNAISLVSRSQFTSIANRVGSKKIEELRSKGYDAIVNEPQTEQTCTDCDVSKLPGGSATYQVKNCSAPLCTQSEKIKEIIIKINWLEKGQTKTVTLQTMIGQGGLR